MKKLIMIVMLGGFLFGFEGAVIKVLTQYFSKESISMVSRQYGSTGLKAVENLTAKYGADSIKVMEKYGSMYGDDGLRLLARYGENAVENRSAFEIVKRFGDEGFYLVKQFPQNSVKYFEKYGDNFVNVANKSGVSRTMQYLDDAAKYGKDDAVLRFLDKYGDKGNAFLDKHWGKLLASGFVLLNADSLIESAKNVADGAIDKGGDVAKDSIKDIANSQLGWMLGMAILLAVFFKFGLDALVSAWKKLRTPQ